MQDYSYASFNSFIEYVAKKGLINPSTASNWKSASARVASLLADEDSTDLRHLDIDSLFRRLANLEGKSMKPASMQVYKSRFRSAVGDFTRYIDNPMTYKPGTPQKITTAQKKPATNKKSAETVKLVESKVDQIKANSTPDETINQSIGSFMFPIPIRQDLVVHISNVPFDLTKLEAEKISSVIKALATND